MLNLLGITTAYAADTAATGTAQSHGSLLSMLPMLIIFIAIFYFLLIRPQSKRAKEQKSLLSNVAVGDEVMTAGGIVAKVIKLGDKFVVLAIGKETQITLKKTSIATVLPKGTMDADVAEVTAEKKPE